MSAPQSDCCLSLIKPERVLSASYSPERNPEERLNADLKQAMDKRVPVRTKVKLRDAANEHMFMLEKSPQRVQSFFQDPRVKYAAA